MTKDQKKLGMRKYIEAFCRDVSGGFIIQFAIVMVPLFTLTGGSMDYVRVQNAKATAQSAADAAALAAAASTVSALADLRHIANEAVNINIATTLAQEAEMKGFSYDVAENIVTVSVEGDLSTSFLRLIGINDLHYAASASATRRIEGSIEVAMVLDNTYSMSVMTSMGMTRINALKGAAAELANTLMADENAEIRIGIVPYGEYVNVGLQYRHEPWIQTVDPWWEETKEVCKEHTTRQVCNNGAPVPCMKERNDGVMEPGICYPDRVCWEEPLAEPEMQCRGGNLRLRQWFGCVNSRTGGLHLTDDQPYIPYVGPTTPRQQCLNPILPLTDDLAAVQNTITNLTLQVDNHRAETYIPSGLMWGINVLSPTAPLEEALAYDPENRNPRKVMVLMTDGANNRRLRINQGDLVGANAQQVGPTYEDQITLCNLAKSRGTEVYTVAFEVTEAVAKDNLLACATSADHYFDATDAETLYAAFQAIARSLAQVRLIR